MILKAKVLQASTLYGLTLQGLIIDSAKSPLAVPSAPTSFAATTTAGVVTFTWVAGVGGGAVASFGIDRSAVGAGSWTEVATATDIETLKAYNLTAGATAYDYRIRAVNASGESASSTIKVWSPILMFEDTYAGAAGYLDARTPTGPNNLSVVFVDKDFGSSGASKMKVDGSGQVIGESVSGRDVCTTYGNAALPDVYTIIDWMRPIDGSINTACPGLSDNKDAAAASLAVKGFTFYGLTGDNKWYFFHHNGTTDTAVYVSSALWVSSQEYKITRRYNRTAGSTIVELLIDDVVVYTGTLGVDHLTNHTHYINYRSPNSTTLGQTGASNSPILNKTQIYGGWI